jgi:hypothetical protein
MQILCPLASGAIKEDPFVGPCYTGLDETALRRIDLSIEWAKRNPAQKSVFWAFGAGTELGYHAGRTLALLAQEYLKKVMPYAKTRTNARDPHYYGTLEEVKWIVNKVHESVKDTSDVEFVFFGPSWHLRRVRLIWLLFFCGTGRRSSCRPMTKRSSVFGMRLSPGFGSCLFG